MANMTSNSPNYSDLLNALSLILAVENLKQNEAQSQYNDVHKANDEQAKLLLKEINEKFEEQNIILREHTALLTEIYKKVGEI